MAKKLYEEKELQDYISNRYRKNRENKLQKNISIDENSSISKLSEKILYLEQKLEFMVGLFEKQQKSFDEFLGILRQSQLQDVRAKEKAYQMIAANNLQSGLRMFMDESRRSDLQMVSYSSKKIGMKSHKFKYGEKSYNTKKA